MQGNAVCMQGSIVMLYDILKHALSEGYGLGVPFGSAMGEEFEGLLCALPADCAGGGWLEERRKEGWLGWNDWGGMFSGMLMDSNLD